MPPRAASKSIQRVNFHHGDAGSSTRPAHDGGVGCLIRRQRRHDGRFEVVSGRDGAVDDRLSVR